MMFFLSTVASLLLMAVLISGPIVFLFYVLARQMEDDEIPY